MGQPEMPDFSFDNERSPSPEPDEQYYVDVKNDQADFLKEVKNDQNREKLQKLSAGIEEGMEAGVKGVRNFTINAADSFKRGVSLVSGKYKEGQYRLAVKKNREEQLAHIHERKTEKKKMQVERSKATAEKDREVAEYNTLLVLRGLADVLLGHDFSGNTIVEGEQEIIRSLKRNSGADFLINEEGDLMHQHLLGSKILLKNFEATIQQNPLSILKILANRAVTTMDGKASSVQRAKMALEIYDNNRLNTSKEVSALDAIKRNPALQDKRDALLKVYELVLRMEPTAQIVNEWSNKRLSDYLQSKMLNRENEDLIEGQIIGTPRAERFGRGVEFENGKVKFDATATMLLENNPEEILRLFAIAEGAPVQEKAKDSYVQYLLNRKQNLVETSHLDIDTPFMKNIDAMSPIEQKQLLSRLIEWHLDMQKAGVPLAQVPGLMSGKTEKEARAIQLAAICRDILSALSAQPQQGNYGLYVEKGDLYLHTNMKSESEMNLVKKNFHNLMLENPEELFGLPMLIRTNHKRNNMPKGVLDPIRITKDAMKDLKNMQSIFRVSPEVTNIKKQNELKKFVEGLIANTSDTLVLQGNDLCTHETDRQGGKYVGKVIYAGFKDEFAQRPNLVANTFGLHTNEFISKIKIDQKLALIRVKLALQEKAQKV